MKQIVFLSALLLVSACTKAGSAGDERRSTQIARTMNENSEAGREMRKFNRGAVDEKIKINIPLLTTICINGTLYIASDSSELNISLTPLYENGADHPTACKGGVKVGSTSTVELQVPSKAPISKE
jgi:hypothetical protein